MKEEDRMNDRSVGLGRKQTKKYRDLMVRNTKRRILIVLTISLFILLISFTSVRIVSAQPVPQTQPPSNITDTSAQLNGLVNPNDQDTYWYFLVQAAWVNPGWGPYSCPTQASEVPGSTGKIYSPVNCQINNLLPSEPYTVVLLACWGQCTQSDMQPGGVLTFTTSSPLATIVTNIIPPKPGQPASSGPAAETDAATSVTDTSVTLNGVVTTNGQDTYWEFAIVNRPSGVLVSDCSPGTILENLPEVVVVLPGAAGAQSVTCQASGLKPSTTYSFFLADCWLPGGATTCPTTVYGSTLTFTTNAPTTKPSTPFDFSIALTPSGASVNPGGTASYMVLLSYSGPSYSGTTINVQLTGLGPGMDYQLSPSGALTITTSPSTPTGTYTFTVVGSALGVTHQTSGALTVTQQSITTTTPTSSVATSMATSVPFDYSVTVSPSTQSVEIGGSASYVVSVIPLAGSSMPVSLTIIGLPGDVRCSFTTQSATPPYTSTLNLDFSTSSANAGAYTLTVLATAAGNVKSATATLIIQPKATQTTTSQTATNGASDVLQRNNMIITAALIGLAVLLGVLGMRSRRQHGVTQQMRSTGIFCSKCGMENPAPNQFCRGCGNKLKGSQVSEAS